MPPSINQGMRVSGSDGARVGTVREVREQDFIVIRPLGRNLYVPFNAVADMTTEAVMLTIPASQVNRMGWETPRTEHPAA